MKKYILELVGLSLAVAAMTSHAADYTYTNVAGTIKITGYIGSGGAITIPSTINGLPVTIIGEAAFHHSDLTGVTSVTIPNSVVSIESSAFAGCDSLTKITLGNGVASIGDYAFGGCDAITSITIPSSISHIGSEVFSACFSLTTINVGANSYYCSVNGVLFNKSQTTLIQYPSDKPGAGYTIPGSVTYIGDGAFSDNMNLTSITIPSSVTTIGTEAFYNCEFLPSITLPSSVTYIGDGAFQRCYALKSVYFKGNAPNVGGSEVFVRDPPGGWGDPEPCYVTVYYLQGASGWSSTFCGRPTALSSGVMLNRLNIIGGTGGGLYANGAKVKISATIPVGMKFARWNDGNTNTPRVITMAAIPVTYTANFTDIAKPTVAIKTPTALQKIFGTNGSFIVTGTATDNLALSNIMVKVNSGSWTSVGTTNAFKNWSTPVTLTAETNTILAYAMDIAGNHSLTSMVKCVYVPTGTLTLQTNGMGTITRSPTGLPKIGKLYKLTAAPGTGFIFANWTGDVSGTNKVVSLTMTSKKTAVANFIDTAKPTVAITYPANNAKVLTNGLVIIRGTAADNGVLKEVKYQLRTGVWTNAVSTNIFKAWTAPYVPATGLNTSKVYSVDMQGNSSATSTVVFTYIPGALLTVQTNLPAGGTITPSLNGKVLQIGSTNTMTATAKTGCIFTNWTYGIGGSVVTNGKVIKFVMTSNLVLTANFRSTTIPDAVTKMPTAPQTIVVDGSSKDWTDIPRYTFSYSSMTQEVSVALDGNNIALLLNGCPFSTSDTVLVYFKLRLTYGEGGDRHTVDLWTSGSVLYGMIDGQVITGLEAVLLNGALEVKIPVEQTPTQVIIEEVGCGMDLGSGGLTELFKSILPGSQKYQ